MSGIFWLEEANANIRVLNNMLYRRLDTYMTNGALEECMAICASIELWLDRLDSKTEPLAGELIAGQEAIRRAKRCERCRAQAGEGER